MTDSAGRGKGKSLLLQIAALLVIALIYTGVRYLIDRGAYQRAHAAYLSGDCAAAQPVYKQILGAFRLGDLGGYEALADQERMACVPYLDAENREASGDLPGAVIAFADIVTDQAGMPLSPAASQRLNALLSQQPPASLASSAVCDRPAELVELAGLPGGGSETLPGLYDACGALYTQSGADENAYLMYRALLEDYPDHALASTAAGAVLQNVYACDTAADLGNDPLFSQRAGFLGDLYFTCGEQYSARQQFKDAARAYGLFLEAYPTDRRAEDVKSALARALIADARQSGAGEIALPEKVTGSGGATTTVVIQNDSPETVRLVFSGPVTRIEELPPCETCVKYYGDGPEYCPEKGPIGSYELPSGSYDVLVESSTDQGVIPFTGQWEMEGGEYFSCFFIVEKP
jgi:hypothetical protein